MGAYYAPQLSHWETGPQFFTPGSIFFTYDYTGRDWTLYFFQNSPALYSNGTLLTAQGSSQVQTITIEDDGKTFTFKPGEMFRIVLPMYDDISKENFSLVAGWDEEGREQWDPASIDFFGFEPKSTGLKVDENKNFVQENTCRALKARQDSKELVFNYHGPSGRNDTFRVTIRIQGSGNYDPNY